TFSLDQTLSIESLAAEMLGLVKSAENPRGMGSKTPIRELVFVRDDSRILLSRVSPGYYLLLLLGEDGGVGRGRFELARGALGLERDRVGQCSLTKKSGTGSISFPAAGCRPWRSSRPGSGSASKGVAPPRRKLSPLRRRRAMGQARRSRREEPLRPRSRSPAPRSSRACTSSRLP